LATRCAPPSPEPAHRRGSVMPAKASLPLRAWTLAHRLANAIRDRPGRRGLQLHLAVLADPLLRYAAGQAIGLSQAGAVVTLYHVDRLSEFGDSASERESLLDEVRALGIDVVRLAPRRLVRTVSQTRALLKDLRDRKVTGLIVQTHFDPRYALASLRLPTLLVLHDPRPHSGDSDAPRWPVSLIARFSEVTASCLMIHSKRLGPQMRRFLRGVPTIVIPHGAKIASSPLSRPRSPAVLVAGRLHRYKGVDSALAAFPAVKRRIPDAKLIIAGRGPLASVARGCNLSGVLVEEGYVSEGRLEQLFEQASVVLLPYRDATQSGVGLLAVGRGIPCVVSAQGALPDLLGPLGGGLTWSSTDPADLTDAIVAALCRDDSFRVAIHKRAAEMFAWRVVAADLIAELAPFGFGRVAAPVRPGHGG
jgi:glycosyltransferase involved in cell wall biosynthesis